MLLQIIQYCQYLYGKYSQSSTELNQIFNPIYWPYIYLKTVIFTGTQEVEVPIQFQE